MRGVWTPTWVLVHVAAVVLVVGFLLLGWWQVGRAASGNLLSFGYAVEWPIFAAFVVFVWVKEIRRALRAAEPEESDTTTTTTEPPVRRPRAGPAYDDSGDEDLAAYNRYLAWLNAHPHASPSEYPG